MKNILDTKLLDKQKLSTLLILKNEAEVNLDEISKTEEIITNKSNNLFQILIVTFTSVFGYVIFNLQKSLIIHISIIFLLFIGYSIFLLKQIIYPDKIKLKGSAPFQLVEKDILFFEIEELNNERILRNRIFSLNIAIQNNLISINKRVDLYRKSNETLFIGIITIILYSIIYLLIVPC